MTVEACALLLLAQNFDELKVQHGFYADDRGTSGESGAANVSLQHVPSYGAFALFPSFDVCFYTLLLLCAHAVLRRFGFCSYHLHTLHQHPCNEKSYRVKPIMCLA